MANKDVYIILVYVIGLIVDVLGNYALVRSVTAADRMTNKLSRRMISRCMVGLLICGTFTVLQ